ncbi:MAG: hypothetical protein WC044_11345 [Crocinitomicaceae bacterium]
MSLINFAIVAFLGVLMRFKIAFSLPWLDQKNLQHAHSHFAFSGWVTLALMVFLVRIIQDTLSDKKAKQFHVIFILSLLTAYGSLFSFSAQGYGPVSIVLSVLTIVFSFSFVILYFKEIVKRKDLYARNWLIAALFFAFISSFGTFYLSFMMATKTVEQHAYLSSVYWYLHFQYNGWFFFACMGLFVHYLQQKNLLPKSIHTVFWMFALSCLPAYGLSILWLDLPFPLYLIICFAAFVQLFAVVLFLYHFLKMKAPSLLDWNPVLKFLFLFIGFALTLKILLQLGSTIPAVAKFAFGFRPIVIAYLHLVLLAFTSLFLVAYLFLQNWMVYNSTSKKGVLLLAIGILFNEIVLAVQGIASLSYTTVPFVNQVLFAISVLLFLSLIVLNRCKFSKS